MASGARVRGLRLVAAMGGSRSQQCALSAMVRLGNHAHAIAEGFVPVFVTALTDKRPVARARPCAPGLRALPLAPTASCLTRPTLGI